MGLSASQGRMLLLTARKSDLEFRAQQISQKRLVLSQQLEEISLDYENATSNRQMKISLSLQNQATEDDIVSKTSNLTYATLVSGTICNINSADSGIQAYSRTEGQQYASTSNYRLVDVYGAIVVSSKDEIPNSLNLTKEIETTADSLGIYRPSTTDEKNEKSITSSTCYVAKIGELEKYLNEKSKDNKVTPTITVDTKTGIVKVQVGNETTYYNAKDGAKRADKGNYDDNNASSAMVVTTSEIPKSKKTSAQDVTLSEGSDGKYTLKDSDGVIIARYIVDETLKYGSTDPNGANDGPNYLQDCLRNGKYLIQKGDMDTESQKVKWKSISWDATSNISDSYYTEDDDKAKAKYDRLQNQVQNQDKKLEIELDNIETQRTAVTTEEESVKKVIDDNIEGSFNAFA